MELVTLEEHKRRLEESRNFIRRKTDLSPLLGVVLGSGQSGEFLTGIGARICADILFSDIPNFRTPTVRGHSGRLILAELPAEGESAVTSRERSVLLSLGRLHYYEGNSMYDVAFPLCLYKELGIEAVLLVNAAGGIGDDVMAGDFVVVKDVINQMGVNPLIGFPVDKTDELFVPMKDPFDPELSDLLMRSTVRAGGRAHSGVYLGTTGPSYETESELRFMKSASADLVGMSLVPEVIIARFLNVRCAALSLVTNLPLSGEVPTTHEEVLDTARESSESLSNLLAHFISSYLPVPVPHPGPG